MPQHERRLRTHVVAAIDERVAGLDRRLEMLEREGLDHNTEEWLEVFARRQVAAGMQALAHATFGREV